jgi:hypothetical protein
MAYRWERRDLLVPIRVEVLLSIIDRHTPIDTIGKRSILHDGHTLIRSICRVLEEHRRGPVVGKVFTEGTCCASSLVANVPRHVGVEGIAAHNLVYVSRGGSSGLDERVKSLDGQSGASESECTL